MFNKYQLNECPQNGACGKERNKNVHVIRRSFPPNLLVFNYSNANLYFEIDCCILSKGYKYSPKIRVSQPGYI